MQGMLGTSLLYANNHVFLSRHATHTVKTTANRNARMYIDTARLGRIENMITDM